ncbi:MAG: hypothetical protein Q8P45_00795, partial [Candidatus Harrisonbacteria bacterium]|nr:hypothetical protein [Candidatus Harrisonbacteria bacterium]
LCAENIEACQIVITGPELFRYTSPQCREYGVGKRLETLSDRLKCSVVEGVVLWVIRIANASLQKDLVAFLAALSAE